MNARSLFVALVVVAVGLGAATGAGATAADVEPAVEVTVGSETVTDGETRETGSDPDLTVAASVGADADNGTELSEVVVRVNGERRHGIAVEGTNVTETVALDLTSGDNDIRVIVTDEAGNVGATAFTVAKDTEAPHVYLTAPYETTPWKEITDGTVNQSTVRLNGTVIEDTGVKQLRVTRRYGNDTYSTALRDVGENFSVPLNLGYGGDGGSTNDVRITAVDDFDNVRIYDFSLNVADSEPPALSLRPLPNETTRNRVFLAGSVSDAVAIDDVSVTVNGPNDSVTQTLNPATPDSDAFGTDRLSAAFNESMYLYDAGTYEATIEVTDLAGQTTTRTVEIERLRGDPDPAPRIAVDDDRTVVLDEETLFLSGVAFEGITERLVVETRAVATDDTVDYQVLHDGESATRVEFDREVGIDGHTEVIVRATDANGEEHDERFYVDGRAKSTFVGEDGVADRDDGPQVTVSRLSDAATGTTSSSVAVEGASAGEPVAVPENGSKSVTRAAPVVVEGLTLTSAVDTDLTATVTARDRSADSLAAPNGSTPAGSVTLQHSIDSADAEGLVLDLSVRQSYLDDSGLDPANLSVYRRSAGNWSALDTERVGAGQSDSRVRHRADSPGLSVFSLATDPVANASDDAGDETGDEPADNGTGAGNGTQADADGETSADEAANETASGDTSGQRGVVVSNVTVNRTAVSVNESVQVNATLVNEGGPAEFTAGLETVHGDNATFDDTENVTVVDTRTLVVPEGERRNVSFTAAFAQTGNHTVSVNGTTAGPVVVGGGGLLSFLSVLSFLPLRLIGMGLGGLVGLWLVLVLVRFVLRKVGGSGDGTSG